MTNRTRATQTRNHRKRRQIGDAPAAATTTTWDDAADGPVGGRASENSDLLQTLPVQCLIHCIDALDTSVKTTRCLHIRSEVPGFPKICAHNPASTTQHGHVMLRGQRLYVRCGAAALQCRHSPSEYHATRVCYVALPKDLTTTQRL